MCASHNENVCARENHLNATPFIALDARIRVKIVEEVIFFWENKHRGNKQALLFVLSVIC
jgi:hypothetical protein